MIKQNMKQFNNQLWTNWVIKMAKFTDSIKTLIQDVGSVQTASQDLSAAIAKLQVALADSQEQIEAINQSIDEFNFKTQPRLAHIQQLQAEIQAELDKFQSW